MIPKILSISLGGWKAIVDRAMTYAGRVVTVINLVLLINISNMMGADMLQYGIVGIVVGVVGITFMVFDIVVIMPQESGFIASRNPVLTEIKKEVAGLRTELIERRQNDMPRK